MWYCHDFCSGVEGNICLLYLVVLFEGPTLDPYLVEDLFVLFQLRGTPKKPLCFDFAYLKVCWSNSTFSKLVGAELVFWGRAFWNVTTQSSVTESPPGQYLGGDCPIGLLKLDFHFFQIARKLHHRLVINISHDRNHNSGQVVKTMRGYARNGP